ncbi:hypothetical protein EON65_52745, partial [archaeon]
TKLGDPIEIEAIASVYGQARRAEQPLYISGAKANFGHMEAASGMLGLFSAMLSSKFAISPPNAGLKLMNKQVSDAIANLSLVISARVEKISDAPCFAAVSSFGYSGTLANTILYSGARNLLSNRRVSVDFGDSVIRRRLHDKFLQFIGRDPLRQSQKLILAYLHKSMVQEWLQDHKVLNEIVVPAAGIIDFIASCSLWTNPLLYQQAKVFVYLQGLATLKPIIVDQRQSKAQRIAVSINDNSGEVKLYGSDYDTLHAYCTSSVVPTNSNSHKIEKLLETFEAEKQMFSIDRSTIVDCGNLYKYFELIGLHYGPSFQLVKSAMVHDNICTCELSLQNRNFQSDYLIPPSVLDALLQTCALFAYISFECSSKGQDTSSISSVPQIPFAFDHIIINKSAIQNMWSHNLCKTVTYLKSATSSTTSYNCALLTMEGELVVRIEGAISKSVSSQSLISHAPPSMPNFKLIHQSWELSTLEENAILPNSVLIVGTSSSCHLLESELLAHGCKHIEYCNAEAFALRGDDSHHSAFLTSYDTIVIWSVAGALDAASELEKTRLLLKGLERAMTLGKTIVSVEELYDKTCTEFILSNMIMCATHEDNSKHMKAISLLVDNADELSNLISLVAKESFCRGEAVEVLYTNGQRYVRGTVETNTNRINASKQSTTQMQNSIIITGGLGGLGLLTAKVLVKLG